MRFRPCTSLKARQALVQGYHQQKQRYFWAKEVSLNHISCWTLSEQISCICLVVLWYKTSAQTSSKPFSQIDVWLQGGHTISSSACQMQLYYASPTCPFTIKKVLLDVTKWAKFRKTGGERRAVTQLFRYLRKIPLEWQCCSLPSAVCVLETEHQDLPWETRCLSSWVLHKYALRQLNQGYFERHQPKPGKQEGLSRNLPNEVPAPPWPQILTTKVFMYFSFKGKLNHKIWSKTSCKYY